MILGAGVNVTVSSPARPIFTTAAPPRPATSVVVVPGPRGQQGEPGLAGGEFPEPPIDLTVLFENALA